MSSSKFILGFFVYIATAFVLAAVVGAVWVLHGLTMPGPAHSAPTTFVLERGMGVMDTAAALQHQGIITNANIFVIGAVVSGKYHALQAGEYDIPSGMSMRDVMRMMAKGDVVRHQITIPEGLTSYEIVQIINADNQLTGTVATIPAEGSLLPQTYDYQRGEDRNAVIARMQKAMDETYTRLCAQYVCQDRVAVITLASLIEKETGVADERARIAGVFANRLKKSIPLQTDPSVIYAITQGKNKNDGMGPLGRRLLRKDLEIDSPYNTYKYPGLPPGPIANPGEAAIIAALQPEPHDYLYFVANGTGGHVFAKSLKEHERNVAQWRKIRRAE